MRLLASNLASMGNIMFSCADSHMFSFDTIAFVSNMIKSDDNIPVKPEKNLSKRENFSFIKRKITRRILFKVYMILKFVADKV